MLFRLRNKRSLANRLTSRLQGDAAIQPAGWRVQLLLLLWAAFDGKPIAQHGRR
jgi:hypothetical protein